MPTPSTAPPPLRVVRAHPWAGLVLLLAMAGGLASVVWGVASGRVVLAKTPVTLPALLDGRASRQAADALADAPLAAAAAGAERALGWAVAADLGPRVRQGCPGWLFLTDELMPQREGAAHAAARIADVAGIRERLAERGTVLLVAVVPDKSRVVADARCGVHRPAGMDARARDWVAGLRRAGVPALDLTDALARVGDASFLRTDTHWSEAGARAAAEAIAEAVGTWPDGRERLGPRVRYRVESGTPQARPGDLIRLAGLDGLPVGWQPAPDRESTSVVEALPREGQTEDDLFGDADLPTVALLGTSFSRTSNFASFLGAALEANVANLARDGGEFGGAARQYFASQAFKTGVPPRLLIWEIPERSLERPLAGDVPAWPH